MPQKNNNEDVFFGYQKVDQKTKLGLVNEIFSKVTDKYDLMNDLMSGGIHRIWKDTFCKMVDRLDGAILDMAGGTGDISAKLYKNSILAKLRPNITLSDLNIDMIDKARDRHYNKNILDIKYVSSAAENLPFPNGSFDYYLVSFGIRNFANITKSLQEAKRVLKPGGRFLCLEFSHPKHPILAKLYGLYSKNIIPNIGGVLGDRDSYKYLVDSIETFPKADEFSEIIRSCGMNSVSYRLLSGGIVAIHSAYKK
ncbi:MAG: class I SAM-dependent methyltransferase [Rickettsiaceae bacterium]|nr:class I SAM-dependent methyltransferase [Rickettsiaceae bacterium]